ncbi:hypothetical protein J6590_071013 [Homalodisca vitripennis]|nr:hypothetical protein J6590_071013 [Homalodisca vitripennis]
MKELHITNRKCRDFAVQGQFDRSSLLRDMTVGVSWGSFPYQRCLLASTRVCHPLPALTGEAGAPLLPGGHDFEISDLILPHGSRFYRTKCNV